MQSNDMRTMETFADRLKRACAYARVDYRPTKIAKNLGLVKQTVHRWMKQPGEKGHAEPTPEHIFLIANSWKVNPKWLATGDGAMLTIDPVEHLTKQELELIAAYRSAQQDGKNTLRAVAKAVGKSALAVVLGLSLQAEPEASQILHNSFSHYTLITRLRLWLRTLVIGVFNLAKQSS